MDTTQSPNKPRRKVVSFKADPDTVIRIKRAAEARKTTVSDYLNTLLLEQVGRG